MIDVDYLLKSNEFMIIGAYEQAIITKRELKELITSLREAEKDAARYRWLRDKSSDYDSELIISLYAESWNEKIDQYMKEKGDE